jgi:hypothetical protein
MRSEFPGALGLVAAIALLAERVVDKMRGNHQTAACHRHGHFGCVGGEAIAEASSRTNEPQTSDHQAKHPQPAMLSISPNNRDTTDRRHYRREDPMKSLFRRQVMHPDRRQRKHDGG